MHLPISLALLVAYGWFPAHAIRKSTINTAVDLQQSKLHRDSHHGEHLSTHLTSPVVPGGRSRRTVSDVVALSSKPRRSSDTPEYLQGGLPSSEYVDHCAVFAQTSDFYSAQNCLNQFRFDPNLLRGVLDSVRNIMAMHIFVDKAKDPPDTNYAEPFNFWTGLTKIASHKYDTNTQWMNDLTNLFMGFRDAHASFTPDCIHTIRYKLALYPVAIVDKLGKTRVFIGAIDDKAPEHLREYIGREVGLIDGRPALDEIWKYARDEVSSYKDQSTRVNRALSYMTYLPMEGTWRISSGAYAHRNRSPPNPSAIFHLLPTHTDQYIKMEVPWYVTNPGGFKNKKEYWELYCKAGNEVKDKAKTEEQDTSELQSFGGSTPVPPLIPDALLVSIDVNRDPLEKADVANRTKRKITAVKHKLPVAISFSTATPGLALFRSAKYPHVAVLKIMTFAIKSDGKAAWYNTAAEIFTWLADPLNQISKVILDVSDNGGGDPCLAQQLTYMFLSTPKPAYPDVPVQFKKDMRVISVFQRFTKQAIELNRVNSYFHPHNYEDYDKRQPFVSTHFINPGRTVLENNEQRHYTKFFYTRCEPPKSVKLRNIKLPFSVSDVVVFNNGVCGSACGRLVMLLRETQNMKGAVLNVFKDRPQSMTGFPATQVVDFMAIANEIKKINMQDDPKSPRPLEIRASLRIPLRESFSTIYEGRALEYLFEPADISINLTADLVYNPGGVWDRLVEKQRWQTGPAAVAT